MEKLEEDWRNHQESRQKIKKAVRYQKIKKAANGKYKNDGNQRKITASRKIIIKIPTKSPGNTYNKPTTKQVTKELDKFPAIFVFSFK